MHLLLETNAVKTRVRYTLHLIGTVAQVTQCLILLNLYESDMHFSNLMLLSCLGLCVSMALRCLGLLFLPGKTKTLDQPSIPTILRVVPVSDTTLPIPVL